MEKIPISDPTVEELLEKMAGHLPKPVRFPFLSSLRHFKLSQELFDIDREMASFRAITGEEEAATCLMIATKLRNYPGSEQFRPNNHYDKSAIIACVMAIAKASDTILRNFHLTFNWKDGRVDLFVPLSNFGVAEAGDHVFQPDEPLNLLHHREGKTKEESVDELLADLAGASGQKSVEKLIREMATARNRLLYASNSRLPFSEATLETLSNRKRRGQILLVLALMVLQTRQKQALVEQSVAAISKIVVELRGGKARKSASIS